MYFKKLSIALLTIFVMNTVNGQQTTWSKQFADAIISRHSNINNLTGKGWEYSNSIVLTGIEKLYYETGDEKYLDYIQRYIANYLDAEGNISFDKSANNLDHLHPGWLCITLYEEFGLEKYKKAADNIRAEFDNQPRNPSGGFWHKQRYENQMWADGIYMASPFLIRYGQVFDDLEYAADEVTHQAVLLADHAYDSTKNLLLHGWDETKSASWADPESGKSPEVWSRGMGWYCMALVDILDYLPETHEKHSRIVEILNGLAIGIKDYQDVETGLWHQVVDKGEMETNWIETSGSSMFVYSLKKAIDNEYIDSATYMPVVQKGWEGLQEKITLDSKGQPVINDFVLGMGIKDDYATYVAQEQVSTPDSRYPHGYCGILLAASVMEFPLPEFYTLSVSKEGSGQVYTDPGQGDYQEGSSVTITANAAVGWEFTGWMGSLESDENPLTISMDSSMSVTATFTESITGIKKSVLNEVLVYPTLADTELLLDLPSVIMLKNWKIVNSMGMILLEGNSSENSVINVSMLPKGMYYIILQFQDESKTEVFIKS